MIVLDSSGWIDWLVDGPRADRVGEWLAREDALVPTVVIYEVAKFMLRTRPQTEALAAVARLREYEVVPLDERIAVEAADISLRHDLPMADALIYATAQVHSATLVTADAHLQGLDGVEFIAAEEGLSPATANSPSDQAEVR